MYSDHSVGPDDGLVAGTALQHAAAGPAHGHHARIGVSHGMDMLGITGATENLLETQGEHKWALIDQACANARHGGVQPGLSLLQSAVARQGPSPRLTAQVRGVGANVFVHCSHARRGIRPRFPGSVAEGVPWLCPRHIRNVRGSFGG